MNRLLHWVATMVPHGRAKRWTYFAATLASLSLTWRPGVIWTLTALAVIFIVRLIDVRRSARRRVRLGQVQGYFFEGRQ